MKCFYFVLANIILCTTSTFAQTDLKVSVFKKDSIQFQQFLDSVKYYRASNQDKAEGFLEAAAQINGTYNNDRWTGNILKLKAILYYYRGGTENVKKAITFQRSELALNKKLQDSILISGSLNNLSILYSKVNDHAAAARYAVKNIALLKAQGKESVELGQAYARIGDTYLKLQLIDSSLINHQRAYDIFTTIEMPEHYDLISASLVKLGYLNSYYKKDHHKALQYYHKAFESFDKKNIGSLTELTMLIGEAYKSLEQYDKALLYYQKAIALNNRDKSGEKRKIASLSAVYLQIAENYQLTSQPDSTLAYVNKVLDASSKGFLQNIELEMLANDLKSKALEKKGDTLLSLTYYKKAQILKDSIKALTNIPETTEVVLANEKNNLLEKEKSLLEKIGKKNTVIIISIISAIIVFVISYLYYIRSKGKVKRLHKNQETLHKNLSEVNEQKDYLNRQITSTSVNLAIKNDLLLKIDDLLQELAQKPISEDDKNAITDTQHLINDTLELNKMWGVFFTHFEKVHPKFMSSLKEKYDLSSNDLRLCAFLKMNLSYKEIGQLLHITQSSLHVTVHRLKKKLYLPKNETVFDFLQVFPD